MTLTEKNMMLANFIDLKVDEMTDINFHEDWNLLMQVVDKICEMQVYSYQWEANGKIYNNHIGHSIDISNSYCEIWSEYELDPPQREFFESGDNRIEATYKAIVSFVQKHLEK